MGRHQAIPLSERRCTKCGRGVAEGARFNRNYATKNGYRSSCVDCNVARIRTARKEHGSNYGRRPLRPVRKLSALAPSEIRILGLVAEGLSDKEIAARLNLNLASLRSRVSVIYGRLPIPFGRSPRVAAALWYHQQTGKV